MKAAKGSASPRVMVALDGSSAAATALPVALAVAEQLSARVQVLHVASAAIAEPTLRRQLHVDSDELRGLEISLRVGDPVSCILDATGDPQVEVVVLTTHGRVIEAGRELGRVARAVIARTRQPILLVRPEAARVPGPLRRLLLPLDGTPKTATALKPAADLACRLAASIDVLYVASPGQAPPGEPGSMGVPRYVDQAHHEWPNWAGEIVERLCACAGMAADVPIRVYLGQGDIGPEIARFAAEHEHDAVILVRRSHLEPGRARVLRAVLDLTSCPVMLVGAPPD